MKLASGVLVRGGRRLEDDPLPRVAEGDVEMGEDILTAQQIKPDAKARGEANCGVETPLSNLNSQSVQVDRDPTSTAYGDKPFLAGLVPEPNAFRVSHCEDRHERPRIDVRLTPFPAARTADAKQNDRTWQTVVRLIGEGYRAHWKSSGRGTGMPMGVIPGCFRRALASTRRTSSTGKTSPPATMTYRPPYLSTSSSKCRRIHSSSLRSARGVVRGFAGRRVGMIRTSSSDSPQG